MRLTWLSAVLILLTSTVGPRAATCPRVALVLALDGSGSVDRAEYAFQLTAVAAALQSEEVVHAMKQAGPVAVSIVFWGDPEQRTGAIGWTDMTAPANAAMLAGDVLSHVRMEGGATGIGQAIWAALDLFDRLPACPSRRIIDISGDGRETVNWRSRSRPFREIAEARRRAEERGATINALTISNEEPDLHRYYEDNVTVGPDSFVMDIPDYAAYEDAIVRKLIRELAESQLAAIP
jgi:hypothetical protein